ncbi:MAG TPA: hypothetical protein PLY34_02770 [Ferruginibacter sp.]|nr:hypothetical protein [Ferruginibacter sp.]HPH92234.1 hypothetical protein [Ferruginibacter sp.]
MIRYYKKFYFLKVYENWFQYNYRFKDVLGLNVYWHVKKQDTAKVPGIKFISHTVELPLNLDSEAITANFSKQIRQQARIAETEGIHCTFQNDIDVFVEFFNDFARKKNTDLVSRRRMEEFGDGITLSFAMYNGEIMAAHSYLIDKEAGIVRHHHAATRRLDEQVDKNLIGRANKYLTVKNILYFKEQGYATFDFGGYAKDTTNESLKGINNYKLLFGGTVVECVNYFSYTYWFFKKLSGLLGMRGKV